MWGFLVLLTLLEWFNHIMSVNFDDNFRVYGISIPIIGKKIIYVVSTRDGDR